jgi:hypothetical protein
LTTAFKSSVSSPLLRGLLIIRKSTAANQLISAIGSNSIAVLVEYMSQYFIGQGICVYHIPPNGGCGCYESYECQMPIGIFNMTMPATVQIGCEVNIPLNDSLMVSLLDVYLWNLYLVRHLLVYTTRYV